MPHEIAAVVCDCGARLERKSDGDHRQPILCGGESGCGRWHPCPLCSRKLYKGHDRSRMCARFGKGKSATPLDEVRHRSTVRGFRREVTF